MTKSAIESLKDQESVQMLYVNEMEDLELFHLIDDEENYHDWLTNQTVDFLDAEIA